MQQWVRDKNAYTLCSKKVRLCEYLVQLLNLACDIPMAFAIKHVHNLPPHLSYVFTLPDIT